MDATSRFTRWMAWVPNALSIGRVVLAVLFPWLGDVSRVVVIIVVAISDWADGVIARRYQVASWTGGLLDAMADKAFALIVLGTYLAGGQLHGWEVLVLLARDMVVLGIVGYLAGMRLWSGFRQMPARMLGKVTTAAMFAVILLLAIWSDPRPVFVQAVLLLTMALSVTAAVQYLVVFLRAEWARRQER